MMRQYWRPFLAGVVLVLLALVALPQTSSVGRAVVDEGARVRGADNSSAAAGQSSTLVLRAGAPVYDGLDSPLVQAPPTPTPTVIAPAAGSPVPSTPSPTQAPPPRTSPSPRRIGLQAGHWKYTEAPAPLNTMTGTNGGGKTEPEVTLTIATEVARILRAFGHTVDILPTVIPRGYNADLFVAIHADGSTNLGARGFFTDRPEGSPVAGAEARLSSAIDFEYAKATGIPYVNRSTPGSHYYYGFREVASSVPTVLIETGFLTNATDREVLVNQPKRSAQGIADGIARYLSH